MAKVRVYELAREFNMDSKVFVEKLKAGGVDIKNYMSTLDEDLVARAKEVLSGTVSEVIEEKRIKPTIIRRRKMTVEVQPEKPLEETSGEIGEAAPSEPEQPQESPEEALPAAEGQAPKTVDAPTETEKIRKKGIMAAGEAMEAASEVQKSGEGAPKTKEKIKKGRKKKAEQPAKIIKKAEEGPLRDIIAKKKEEVEEKPDLRPVEFEAAPGEIKIAVPEEPREKPSKKKKGRKRVDKDDDAGKGHVRYRKVEVFERADLYDGRKVKRKKKDASGKDAPKALKHTEITVPKAIKRRIKVPEQVTVAELAKAMGVKGTELVKRLLKMGAPAAVNQSIDFETASLVAEDFGYELELDQFEIESIIEEVEEKPEDLKPRPPVVTIMGHVDHGKTSLLDYIRNSNIIAGESGGITQHIGAYYVEREGGDIVFLDTPGHEAFTAMRARGAKVTDIIVLVVAADDGVMPQTKEAVNHARAANIPIIVAVNKIDKPEANLDKVRRELSEVGLMPEEWGGDSIFGNISAKTGEGVEELLELILLQSEMLELKANPDKPAKGTIIEARLDKSRGSIATVLIKEGTIRQGDYFICGEFYGRVRAMLNHLGRRMKSAGPSMPVEIYGISGVPMAGDELIAVQEEKKARQIIEHRQSQIKMREMAKRATAVSLTDIFERIKEGQVKELNIVLKADVQGSLEALADSLLKLSTSEVKLRVIHSSTGAITETDVMLASASGAVIIGFNVRGNPRVVEIAKTETVDIRYYDVIYNAIQDVRNAMAGLLDPICKENVIGRADVKEVFHVPKVGTIAGCYVTDGHIERNAHARLLRDEVVVFDGKVSSLRRFKDDVKEVQSGYECGIGLENYQDLKPGDVFEVYQIEEVAAEL
ncbi:MAG: translation initiation factor IF-2 [Pseudomonadota bacterium]